MARRRGTDSAYLGREMAIMGGLHGLYGRFGAASYHYGEYRYRGAKEINLEVRRTQRQSWWGCLLSERAELMAGQSKSPTRRNDEDANEHGLLPIIHPQPSV